MRITIQALTLALLLSAMPAPALAGDYLRTNVEARYIWNRLEYLPTAGTYTWETTNLQDADTIMYLWDLGTDTLAAMDDDGGVGLASKITFPTTSGGYYLLIIISYPLSPNEGRCDLLKDGQSSETYVPVGGTWLQRSVVSGDTVQTALMNPDDNGATDTMLYTFDSGIAMKQFSDDSGIGYASKLLVSSAQTYVAVGTKGPGSGDTSVITNDLPTDVDGDGLGQELEEHLCTCNYGVDYSCGQYCFPYVSNVEDSDGDGLPDNEELFGHESPTPSQYDYPQHLAAWGADPARKDVFVEVDWHPTAGAKLDYNKAISAANAYIVNTTGSGFYLRNRDGSDGVRVHFDIGTASAGTQYGDWGGAGRTPPGYNLASNLPPEQFAPVRNGRFHYAYFDNGCCGNGDNPGFKYRAGDLGASTTLAHELGHNLDLRHGGRVSRGDQNNKPNYPSIMSYAYDIATISPAFSLGNFDTAPLNPVSLCESDGLKVSDRNKVAYLEGTPFSYTVEAICSQDGNPNCGIDWNRDGVISGGATCQQLVHAAPNWPNNQSASPELGRHNEQNNGKHPTLFTSVKPDDSSTASQTRAFGRYYLAYRTTANNITLLHTNHEALHGSFKGNCTEAFSGCAQWTTVNMVTNTSMARGPLIAPHGSHLMLVYADQGWLKYKKLDSNHNAVSSGTIPGTQNFLFEPVMARYGNDLLLLYRTGTSGQNGPIYGNIYNGTWSASNQQMEGTTPIITYSPVAMASKAQQDLRTVFVHLSPGGGTFPFRWMQYDTTTSNKWIRLTNTGIENYGPSALVSVRRAGLAYRPHTDGLTGGRWYLAYNEMDDGDLFQYDGGVIMGVMTRGDGSDTWNSESQWDNVWFHGKAGVDLFGWQPFSTSEANVRMVINWHGDPHYVLQFRPYADGIYDIQLEDNNDFEVMNRGICASIHSCKAYLCSGNPLQTDDICLGHL